MGRAGLEITSVKYSEVLTDTMPDALQPEKYQIPVPMRSRRLTTAQMHIAHALANSRHRYFKVL